MALVFDRFKSREDAPICSIDDDAEEFGGEYTC
jgi:hypothetical protein